MKKQTFFDKDGDLLSEIYLDVAANGATDEKALAFLASEFADETHGNYNAETLFSRVFLGRYDIVISPKKRE